MGNERLRAAITSAGLDADGLADRIGVDVKTVHRWLSGRTPYARHRARVANALEREQHELWPDVVIEPAAEDARREIVGAWPYANDLGAPDWRAMMKDTVERIDLAGYTLIDILSAAGVTELLAAKAQSGCQVRVMIAATDSVWVESAALELGQDEEDYVSRSELLRELELARAYLEPLIGHDRIDVRGFYAERFNTILRFDDQMLVHLHLWGVRREDSPLLHLRRRGDDGLFDRFQDHLTALADQASEPLEPAPELYPDPRQHPDRYKPVTAETYEHQWAALQADFAEQAACAPPPDEGRAQLRHDEAPHADQPAEPASP